MKKLILIVFVSLMAVACGGGVSYTPQNVIDAFQDAGLEAESPSEMTSDDYGLAPFVGNGVRFLIPSLGEGSGGRVIAVDNSSERDELSNYYKSLGEQNAAFFSWVFVKENIVVQINGSLDEDTARQYEAALNGME